MFFENEGKLCRISGLIRVSLRLRLSLSYGYNRVKGTILFLVLGSKSITGSEHRGLFTLCIFFSRRLIEHNNAEVGGTMTKH